MASRSPDGEELNGTSSENIFQIFQLTKRLHSDELLLFDIENDVSTQRKYLNGVLVVEFFFKYLFTVELQS